MPNLSLVSPGGERCSIVRNWSKRCPVITLCGRLSPKQKLDSGLAPPRLDVVRGADAEANEQTKELLQLGKAGVAAGVREQAFGSSVRIRVPDDFHQELVSKQQPKELSCARGIRQRALV